MSTLTRKSDTDSLSRTDIARRALLNLRRRRSYLIDPSLQMTITRQFLVVLVAASALSIGNYHIVDLVVLANDPQGVDRWIALAYCGVMLTISAGLLFLLCVFFSHRIAGPARKISEGLSHMAGKDLCVLVRLRDADLLKELATAINATSRELRRALMDIETDVHRARALADGSPEIDRCLKRIERHLSEFHFTDAAEIDQREMASRVARERAA
jgi:methyl-accepting chemotaxis protein